MKKLTTSELESAKHVLLRLIVQLDDYTPVHSSRKLYSILEDIMDYQLFSAALAYLVADGKLKYTFGIGYSLLKK